MKLLIGIPTMDFVHVEFMKCLCALIQRLRDEKVDFTLDINSGTLVYLARERIAHRAINEEYTHVLWLDSDMIFQPSLLDDLIFSGKSFVTGIYHARRKGYASCIFKSIEINKIERFEEYPAETFEISGCGFGCVLVETEILKSVCLNKGTCFTPLKSLGEDIAFCQRAREMGFKLYCEPSVVCGHIGHITIYPEDHELWKTTISNYGEV
jgi:GT2 family glycosyltransferase